MLEINHLSIKNKSDGFGLVKDLSVTINAGEKWAIIGHEGVGKSTLLKTILAKDKLLYLDVSGTINIKGTVGYLEQDIRAQWSHINVQDYFLLDDPTSEVDYTRYDDLKNLSYVLNRVKLDETSFDVNKTVGMFSGGELIKLGLAKLLLRDVDILLLDEPTNDLDFETILFLETFILEETRAVLYVSHDERLLENTAEAVIHLMRVKKKTEAITYVEKMPYETYKAFRLSHYSKSMQRAKKERANHQAKIKRFERIFSGVEHAQNQAVRVPSTARLLAKKMKSLKAMEKRLDKEAENFHAIPEREAPIELVFTDNTHVPKGKRVIDLHLSELRIEKQLLARNVELLIKGPEKVVITGRNGSGKTTLLKEIEYELKRTSDLRVGVIPQSYSELDKPLPVLEFLKAHKDKKKEAVVRKYLGSLQFEREEMSGLTCDLSGGQKAKLYLLKCVLEEKQVLILDEPTRNLSPLSAPEVYKMLQEFNGCIICVSHDRAFIENVFDRVFVLKPNGLEEV